MSSIFKNIIAKSALNTFGNLFNRFSRYFSVLIVIKILGVTHYGYYVIGLTIIGIGIILANIGMNYGVFRFIPIFIGQGDTAKIKGIISFSLVFVTISGLTVTFFLFLFSELISVSFYNKPALDQYIKFLSFAIPFSVLSGIIINIFKGFDVIKYKVLIEDFIIIISRILFLFYCLVFGLGTIGVIISYTASILLGLIIGIIFLLKIFPDIKNSDIISTINKREVFSYSMPLFLSSFLVIFLNQTDILMLSYYLSADNIGIYSVANKLAVLVFFVSSSSFAIFSPAIAKLLGEKKRDQIQDIIFSVVRLILIITIPIFLIITIFSKDVLLIFGKEFSNGNSVLLILALSFFLSSIFGFAGQVLSVMGRSKLIMINSLGAGILNIVLNYILIPKYGLIGAAIATGSSIIAVNIARVIETYFFEGLLILTPLLVRPLLVCFTTGSVVIYLKHLLNYQVSLQYFIGFVSICLALYCILTWFLVLTKNDKILFNEFLIKD